MMRGDDALVILCLGLLAVAAVPAAGSTNTVVEPGIAAATDSPTVEGVEYVGDGAYNGSDGQFLWSNASHAFEATVDPGLATGEYDLCLYASEQSANETLTCQAVTMSGGNATNATLSVDSWPSDGTGERNVTVALLNATGTVVSQQTEDVTVRAPEGDVDGDGLSNEREAKAGTALDRSDTDGDGLDDKQEVRSLETDPLKEDTDGDGLSDGAELSKYKTDPLKEDTDGDGLDDATEVRETGSNPNKKDTDGDGLDDRAEVVTYGTDPTTADTDDDSLDDGAEIRKYNTDPLAADTDGDGLDDGPEVHVHGTEPTTEDTDGDGLSDQREVEQTQTDPTDADTDNDGLEDGPELNTYGTSPITADSDGDGFEDGREASAGTDPLDPGSHPETIVPGWLPEPDSATLAGGLAVLVSSVLLIAIVSRYRPRTLDPTRVAEIPNAPTRSSTSDEESDEQTVEGADSEKPTAENASPSHEDTRVEDHHLLTNEERVQQLLEDNGGRLHQSEIVDATDWSKSKVSRVLSRMESDGRVSKIPLGKENLITIPGEEPEGAKSPHASIDDP